jgi:hypothetical protein
MFGIPLGDKVWYWTNIAWGCYVGVVHEWCESGAGVVHEWLGLHCIAVHLSNIACKDSTTCPIVMPKWEASSAKEFLQT